jgi:hypothetical protein
MRSTVLAKGRVDRGCTIRLRRIDPLQDLLLAEPGLPGELGDRRRATELLPQTLGGLPDIE